MIGKKDSSITNNMVKCWVGASIALQTSAKLADRSRIVKHRVKSGVYDRYRDNNRPIEGQNYILGKKTDVSSIKRADGRRAKEKPRNPVSLKNKKDRKLGQYSGCCSTYSSYSAVDLCAMYGNDCESGEGGQSSHDSGDEDCYVDGLAFIGYSFSVNTAYGNPYSYQLNDQFPMENIIDRKYDYIMSMDEDGWLVGGGYKAFDYSGKMPYIDSSHTELLRVGSMNPDTGGTTIDSVYSAMADVTFPPFEVFPEYLKGGGGHHSGDEDGDDDGNFEVPSSDVTLVVSIVCTYDSSGSYCLYEQFIEELFSAMYAVSAGACMDDHDTDPHVSMSRGVKFHSSYTMQQYMYAANLEVAVWQSMYPNGVVMGSSGYAAFPPGRGGTKQQVGYGNMYFFFDRANITKAFSADSYLSDEQSYYATLMESGDVSSYYSDTTEISFDYSGSGDGGDDDGGWEHNPYAWKASMAMHDMTDGWNLPPNCYQEGETFFGIPLSQNSDTALQSAAAFQEQFDFSVLIDYNYTYINDFGTNHGWLIGEKLGNAAGSIVDKDTAHIPIFHIGTTNPDMGGMSLSDMIKVAKNIEFGQLFIKPAFVFIDGDGHLKLQFEADSNSALGYLYTALCQELGITWNYNSPSNNKGLYTNCAMHSAGDKASNGCGPDSGNSGGFCPQMYIAYEPKFHSEDYAAAYLEMANNYVDYWRSLYSDGVAVGTNKFCPNGGCLGLFLNRMDLYQMFSPDLQGSWVEYGGASLAPTFSPAPTYEGGCDEPRNYHLDKCYRKHHRPKKSQVAWESLGSVGQFTIFLVAFMATTLSLSIFLARARRRKRKNESYISFFFRDLNRKRKKRRKTKKLGSKSRHLEEDLVADENYDSRSRRSSRSRSRSISSRSRSKSKGRSRSASRSRNSRRSQSVRGIRPTLQQPESDRSRSVSKRRKNTSENIPARSRSRNQLV